MTVASVPAAGEAPRYRRLPGRTRGLMGSSSLWLAGDHMLLVHSRGYVETYRRFYFRDIQAVLLRRTAAAWIWTVVLAIPLALTLLGALLTDGVSRTSLSIAAGAFALALLVHALRGASCVCHIRTAVEQTELKALRRLRVARRTCERLRALVEAAQGRVAIETLARGAPGESAAEARVRPRPLDHGVSVPPQDVDSGVALPPRHVDGGVALPPGHVDSGVALPPRLETPSLLPPPAVAALKPPRWHAALFALLAVDAALSFGQVAAASQLLDAGALVLGIAEFLVGIFALVEGRRRRRDTGLRRATLASLVYVCAAFVAGWITSVAGSIQAAMQGKPTPQPLSSHWLALASIPVTLVLAGWGFVGLRRARRAG